MTLLASSSDLSSGAWLALMLLIAVAGAAGIFLIPRVMRWLHGGHYDGYDHGCAVCEDGREKPPGGLCGCCGRDWGC